MDSPGPYDELAMDGEDVVYPCKGCGEILEEGKAFELAGNRWHIDCFRCHTCGTLLDSDANLLLLGDGSLICNNCTYSCSACGNKIEDLAILTGDQAFCAGCFRCRSCKRKIDNLRYARTSQGIFCMSCHESLMSRRRKKAKDKASKTAASNAPAVTKEKALPQLPIGAIESAHTSPVDNAVRAVSPNQRLGDQISLADAKDQSRSIPFKEHTSPIVALEVDDDEVEQGYLPMAFDPNPPRAPPPRARQDSRSRQRHDESPATEGQSRDYFPGSNLREAQNTSRSTSVERDYIQNLNFPQPNTSKISSHIASQDKNRPQKRTTSGANTPNSVASPSPTVATSAERNQSKPSTLNNITYDDSFKLQSVPKERKQNGRVASRSPAGISTAGEKRVDRSADNVSPISDDSVNPFEDPKLKESSPSVPAPIPTRHADRPARGDSLAASKLKSASNRSSVDPPAAPTTAVSQLKSRAIHERQESASSIHTALSPDEKENDFSEPLLEQFNEPPPRASSRPSAPVTKDDLPTRSGTNKTTPGAGHQRSASAQQGIDEALASGRSSPALRNGALPKFTSEGSFSMDKEMSRILKGDRDQEHDSSPSVLRRVSNAVKHGRSFSDRGSLAKVAASSTSAADSSLASPSTISSPLGSPSAPDTVDSLRAQLRRAQHRVTELETEKNALQEKVNSSIVIKEVTSELNEKRNTMAFLDSQREIVVRELEVMTRHLQNVKEQKQPLDLPALKSNILEDFAAELKQLKDHVGTQIEEQMRRRNELSQEIADLIAMKDKGFQEYESLQVRNGQLVDMNHNLLHNIQEGFKANRTDPRSNGLGIYHPGARVDSAATSTTPDSRSVALQSESSMANLLQDQDADSATMLAAPQVVNIRKGQVKKFNWRKGGASVAKGVTKGIKGAFVSEKSGIDVSQIGLPYGMTQQAMPGVEQNSRQHAGTDRTDPRFALFNQKNGRPPLTSKDSGSSPTPLDPSTLFGSDLEERCEYEKRIIPGIVTRCIAEVESRGMRTEGIYRKSGGSGQVKSVQAGFEKDQNHDISDPDLEIHAVTSALKQYFRKLPSPLITFEVYDLLLQAGGIQGDIERQVVALRAAVNELPQHHKGCLEYLVRHLARVMQLERENLMTSLNLAVVFAPTIMRPASIDREMADSGLQRTAVQALLELHEAVFEEE